MTEVSGAVLHRRNHRLINQDLKNPPTLGPIVGYTQEPLPSLLEACKPLIGIIDNIDHYVSIALETTPEQPPDDLTHDESAAIRIYTMEWDDRKPSLYSVLNRTLRTEHREKLQPWFKYLALFLTALVKIPCAPLQVVWRGVAQDISAQFPRGTDVTWWSFSSCTTTLTVLENALYLGNATNRTLFSIEAFNARNVSAHSYFQTEDEILLLPGTYMEVRSQLHPAADLHIIHLRQKIPEEILLEPPFPDAPIYPIDVSSEVPFYRKKRCYVPMSLLVVGIVIASVLGSILGTRSSSTPDVCNITTLATLTRKYETMYGLWSTTASGDSAFSMPGSGMGEYNSSSPPQNALDQNSLTDYISFGSCSNRTVSKLCGIDTGFTVVPAQGATLLLAFQFITNMETSTSDPLTITIEGSNKTYSALGYGKSWSLIYNGSTGLDKDPGRSMKGAVQCFNNTILYTAYRILVTSKRGISDSVQYGEIRLIGQENSDTGICNITTLTLLTNANELVYGLWNTKLLGDGTQSWPGTNDGNYNPTETPRYALDQNTVTKYRSYGRCGEGIYDKGCGIDTGFYVTPQQGATLLKTVQFTTAFDVPARDPISITIEGSNAPGAELMRGASWSLIGTLSTGLDADPGREADGVAQCLAANTIWYKSYRILVTSTRDAGNSIQYSEVKLFGYRNPNIEICEADKISLLTSQHETVVGLTDTKVSQDGLLAKPGQGVNNYVSGEIPRYVFDRDSNTKYATYGYCFKNANFSNCGVYTGFYVTPQQGSTLLLGIQFTTANGMETRDPLTITIEGSNANPLALMLGPSWSFISEISTGLDYNPGRKADGVFMCLFTNAIWYKSYRIIVTSVRGFSDFGQYSEVMLFGRGNPNKDSCRTTTLSLLTSNNEVVYGLTTTTLSGDGTLATPGISVGNYRNGEGPSYALDQNENTKYTSFGGCYLTGFDQDCGVGTGFYVSPEQGPTLLLAIQFTTAINYPVRDPMSITIEGSNASSSALMRGASWSWIDSLSTGLELSLDRKTDGELMCLRNNTIWYTSYRILITSVRDITNCVQYGEVKLLGYGNPNRTQDNSVPTF